MAAMTSALAVCLFAASAAAAVPDLPQQLDKVFLGRLGGKYDVRLQLQRDGGALSGHYSYVHVAESLLGLEGTIDARGAFTMDEFDAGKKTGTFKGQLSVDGKASLLRLTGVWSKADGSRTLRFSILEDHLEVDGAIVRYATETLREANEKARYEITAHYPRLEGTAAGVAAVNARVKDLTTTSVAAFKKDLAEVASMPKPVATSSQMDVDYTVLTSGGSLIGLRFFGTTYFEGTAHPSHPIDCLLYTSPSPRDS